MVVVIPFPTRCQAWHRCRPEPGLQGRAAGVSQEHARSCPRPGASVQPPEERVTAGALPVVGDPVLTGPCLLQPWPGLRVVGVFVFI